MDQESGLAIIERVLASLASELNEPKINDLRLEWREKDFDFHSCSLIDPTQGRLLMKIREDELANCWSDGSVRDRFEARLVLVVRSYYGATSRIA